MATTTVSNIRPSIEVLKTLRKVLTRRAIKPVLGSIIAAFAIRTAVTMLWTVEHRTTAWGTNTDAMNRELELRSLLWVALLTIVAPLFARSGAAAVIDQEKPEAGTKVSAKTVLWIGAVLAVIQVGGTMASSLIGNLPFDDRTAPLVWIAAVTVSVVVAIQSVRLTPAIAYAALGSSTPMKDSRRMIRGRFWGTTWRMLVAGIPVVLVAAPLFFIPSSVLYADIAYIPVIWGLYAFVSGAVSAMISIDIERSMVYPRLKTR